MTFEESLFKYLSTYAGLTALVSKKIFPNAIPQKTALPAIVYTKVSGEMMMSATEGNYGLCRPVYQISVHSSTYTNLKSIVTQVKNALLNYSGTMGGTGGIDIQGCFLVSEFDDYTSGDGTEVHSANLDFEFYYNE